MNDIDLKQEKREDMRRDQMHTANMYNDPEYFYDHSDKAGPALDALVASAKEVLHYGHDLTDELDFILSEAKSLAYVQT